MTKERNAEARWIENQSRWCCRVMVNGKRKAFYSTTPGRRGKREAERKADEWVSKGAPDNMRVGGLWEEFMEHERHTKGDKNPTYKQHSAMGRLYILPVIEYLKLDSITTLDWQNCIDEPFAKSEKAGHPLSVKSLKNIRGALSAFKTYCAKRGIMLSTLHDITIPSRARAGERTILQPDDLVTLFSSELSCSDAHYLNAWQFQVLTGLRPGELYALKWEDIKTEGICTVTVRRSVNVDGIITDGKNTNAWRTIPLIVKAMITLEHQQAYLRQIGVISPYVFPDRYGNITQQKSAAAQWRRFTEAHGMTTCSPYELRHTMVSVSADVPDSLLKRIVGHGERFDSRGVYGHEVKGDRERTAQMLSLVFDEILSS